MRFIIPVAIDDTPISEPAVPTAFRGLHWQRIPAGRTTPEFVAFIVRQYQEYQKTVVNA